MSNKNSISISIVLIIIAMIAGYYLGSTQIIPIQKFLQKQVLDNQVIEFEECKKEECGISQGIAEMSLPPIPDEIYWVSGTIKEIKDDSLIIEIMSLTEGPFPGEQPKMEERKIIIEEDTKLVEISPILSPATPEYIEGGIAPKEEIAKLADFKINDTVNVESGDNIKTKKEFIAKKIIIYNR